MLILVLNFIRSLTTGLTLFDTVQILDAKLISVIASESYRTEYKYNYCNYHYLYLSLYLQLLEDAVSQDLEEVSEKNQLMVVDSLVSAMQG